MTPAGWLEALRPAGELKPETQTWRRAQSMVQALKARVQGRNQFHDALVDARELTPEIPGEWAWNAITSGLLAELFGEGMNAYADRGLMIRVPRCQWKDFHRALCLLDPYDLSIPWTLVQDIGRMRSVEIFYNFMIMDANRNALWNRPELPFE